MPCTCAACSGVIERFTIPFVAGAEGEAGDEAKVEGKRGMMMMRVQLAGFEAESVGVFQSECWVCVPCDGAAYAWDTGMITGPVG